MRTGMDSGGRRSFDFGAAPRATFAILTLALVGATALPACSSSGAKSSATTQTTGKPIEFRYRAVAKNLSFGLVNASHTDRTELYSSRQPLDQATTKVSPDEVVDAIVEYFREEGFFSIAQAGKAPRTPPPGASQILEVALPDGAWFAVMQPGVSTEYATTFQTCSKALLDVYNSTMQLQAVENAPAWGGGEASSRSRGTSSGGTPRSGG